MENNYRDSPTSHKNKSKRNTCLQNHFIKCLPSIIRHCAILYRKSMILSNQEEPLLSFLVPEFH